MARVFQNNSIIVYFLAQLRSSQVQAQKPDNQQGLSKRFKSSELSFEKEYERNHCSRKRPQQGMNNILGDGQKGWPLHCIIPTNKLSADSCPHRRGEENAFQGPTPCCCQLTKSLFLESNPFCLSYVEAKNLLRLSLQGLCGMKTTVGCRSRWSINCFSTSTFKVTSPRLLILSISLKSSRSLIIRGLGRESINHFLTSMPYLPPLG